MCFCAFFASVSCLVPLAPPRLPLVHILPASCPRLAPCPSTPVSSPARPPARLASAFRVAVVVVVVVVIFLSFLVFFWRRHVARHCDYMHACYRRAPCPLPLPHPFSFSFSPSFHLPLAFAFHLPPAELQQRPLARTFLYHHLHASTHPRLIPLWPSSGSAQGPRVLDALASHHISIRPRIHPSTHRPCRPGFFCFCQLSWSWSWSWSWFFLLCFQCHYIIMQNGAQSLFSCHSVRAPRAPYATLISHVHVPTKCSNPSINQSLHPEI
jgi:hypothetical protein